MIFKIPRHISKGINLHEYISKGFLNKSILYMIDWKTRRSVILSKWLSDSMNNLSDEFKEYASKIKKGETDDETIINILQKVNKDLTYVSDKAVWTVDEYWQTPNETLQKMTGDCEDGSIFIYALAIQKGISKDKLLIICGDVTGGGHCWIAYKPDEYPLNFVFIDWCYWYNKYSIEIRPFFYVNKQTVLEYNSKGQQKVGNYKKIWFAFNETWSNTEIKYKNN